MDTEFTPHGFCLAWEPVVLWFTVLGHAGVAAAYAGIPFLLLMGLRRVLVVPIPMVLLFAAFIALCGVSHILEVVVLWWPAYWALAIEVAATGVVSLVTMAALPEYMRDIEQSTVRKEIAALMVTMDELRRRNEAHL